MTMFKIGSMRGFLSFPIGTSSAGLTCAAVLTLPLTLPAAAAPAGPTPTVHGAGGRISGAADPGSTRSLPLVPLTRERVLGSAPVQGVHRQDVRHFSLVGVVWDNPGTELHGQVQVRTRSTGTGRWTGWQAVETHNDHGADPDTAESTSGRVHGATAPLWVGDSDAVEVQVRADVAPATGDGRASGSLAPLPSGLRLELVDPGADSASKGSPSDPSRTGVGLDDAAAGASAANSDLVPLGAAEIPALSKEDSDREAARLESGREAVPLESGRAVLRKESGREAGRGAGRETGREPDRQSGRELGRGSGREVLALHGAGPAGTQRATPYTAARPRIVTRSGWSADESLRERGFVYTTSVKAAFVHHTASGNNYTCSQAPSVIRSIYRYHVKSMGWRDIGYNFLVDKCGNIYEGRAGGVTKAVQGAHTLGFNSNSMGVAVIGTFNSTKPSSSAVTGIAQLTAWKLGLFGADPEGKTYLTSGGGNLYPKGKNVQLNVISGHRDGYATDCPGKDLYSKLGSVRTDAARYQGR
jgi:hypothetical protein